MTPSKHRAGLAMTTAATPPAPGSRTARVIPRVPSASLLGEHGELIIEHAGREYKLRRTSNGKLLLTA